jgi:hypothetical protein
VLRQATQAATLTSPPPTHTPTHHHHHHHHLPTPSSAQCALVLLIRYPTLLWRESTSPLNLSSRLGQQQLWHLPTSASFVRSRHSHSWWCAKLLEAAEHLPCLYVGPCAHLDCGCWLIVVWLCVVVNTCPAFSVALPLGCPHALIPFSARTTGACSCSVVGSNPPSVQLGGCPHRGSLSLVDETILTPLAFTQCQQTGGAAMPVADLRRAELLAQGHHA